MAQWSQSNSCAAPLSAFVSAAVSAVELELLQLGAYVLAPACAVAAVLASPFVSRSLQSLHCQGVRLVDVSPMGRPTVVNSTACEDTATPYERLRAVQCGQMQWTLSETNTILTSALFTAACSTLQIDNTPARLKLRISRHLKLYLLVVVSLAYRCSFCACQQR